jgi:uncharacterized protein YdaU (DUF1376 family)
MAKDPAFLFYAQDWITGTLTMTMEERGQYITILSVMHQTGRMDEKTIRFLVGNVSDNLKAKFSIDKDGKWFNERLEDEIEKRTKFSEQVQNLVVYLMLNLSITILKMKLKMKILIK